MTDSKDITKPETYGCQLHINKPALFDPSKPVALDVETDEEDNFAGLAMCQSLKEVYFYDKDQWCDEFADFVGSFNFIMHGGRFDIRMLKKWGVKTDYDRLMYDTKIMAYSMDSTLKAYGLKPLSKEYVHLEWQSYKDMVGSGKKKTTLDKQEVERVARYCGMDTLAEYTLSLYLWNRMTPQQHEYYSTIEMPLYRLLSRMEDKGVTIDRPYLSKVGSKLAKEVEIYEREFDALGFNPRSPKQILEYLKKQKLPVKKTDVATLKEIDDPVIRNLLDYRKFKKIHSTYVEPFLKHESPRIHAQFTQSTITGRLASRKPNLQNIPAPDPEHKRFRVDVGTMIRKAFVPQKSHSLLVLDYSQIEYRLFAHFTQEPVLLEAFHNGKDVHEETAKAIGAGDNRRLGKTINFAAIYGAQAKRIAATAGITTADAEELLQSYWTHLPRAAAWITMQKLKARRNGGVTTMMGRFIPLSLIKSNNKFERLHWERVAVNAIVQGSAAEVIKLAMLRLKDAGITPIMQVHDELMFEVPNNVTQSDVLDNIKKIMETAVKISVPLEVDGGYGKNWVEAK